GDLVAYGRGGARDLVACGGSHVRRFVFYSATRAAGAFFDHATRICLCFAVADVRFIWRHIAYCAPLSPESLNALLALPLVLARVRVVILATLGIRINDPPKQAGPDQQSRERMFLQLGRNRASDAF